MNVCANLRRSLAVFASASNFSRGTRSILFSTSILACWTVASLLRMASASSSMPSRASMRTQTRSASWAPLQAVDTIARSSRRLGQKMPGVSTRMIWAWFSTTMPRISARVVCTLRETMVTLEPTSALTSVDLPTLGAPISATKPQRVGASAVAAGDPSIIAGAADAFALDHHGGCELFSGALAAADALCRRQARQLHGHAKLWVVMRSGAFDLAIDWRRQALALRPFLQHRLGIAQRTARLVHPLRPVSDDELRRRLVDVVEEPERLRHIRATFLAHEVGQALGQLAFIGAWERAIKHVGDDQTKNVVAEKFEALIALAPLARGFQGGDVGEGGGQQGRVGEFVPDTRLQRGGGRLGADPGALFPARCSLAGGIRLKACFAWR